MTWQQWDELFHDDIRTFERAETDRVRKMALDGAVSALTNLIDVLERMRAELTP